MRLVYYILTMCCALCLTGRLRVNSGAGNYSDAAEDAFEKVVAGINKKDGESLINLFSANTQNRVDNLDGDIDRFINMFNGEITAYHLAGGSNTSRRSEHGKISVIIKSSYIVESSNEKFHVAVEYCAVDMFDCNNEGLNSINIISETDYQSTYVYRGDGQWSPGITFDAGSKTGGRGDGLREP